MTVCIFVHTDKVQSAIKLFMGGRRLSRILNSFPAFGCIPQFCSYCYRVLGSQGVGSLYSLEKMGQEYSSAAQLLPTKCKGMRFIPGTKNKKLEKITQKKDFCYPHLSTPLSQKSFAHNIIRSHYPRSSLSLEVSRLPISFQASCQTSSPTVVLSCRTWS